MEYAVLQDAVPQAILGVKTYSVSRGRYVVHVLDSLYQQDTIRLGAYLRGAVAPFRIGHDVTRHLRSDGANYHGALRGPDGAMERYRPLFFVTYSIGTAARTVRPIVRPSDVLFPTGTAVASRQTRKDFQTSPKRLRARFAPFLATARQTNTGVDLEMTPEDFPYWVYPRGTPVYGPERRAPFGLLDPKGRAMIGAYLETALDVFGQSPVLRRVILTPSWQNRLTSDTARILAWHAYLRRLYRGRLYLLNAMHHTAYTDFSQVPSMDSVIRSWPAFYDWCQFSNDRFSRWHQWMADRVHRVAPAVPVYIRLSPGAILASSPAQWDGIRGIGYDVDMEFVPGLDADRGPPYQSSLPVRTLLDHLMVYDLANAFHAGPLLAFQRYDLTGDSLAMQAVYLRTALWQGAIHGVGEAATTVQDHPGNDVSSMYTGAAVRPDLALVRGETRLDLLRLGKEVAAVRRGRADVAILYSDPSVFYPGPYLSVTARAYDALALGGHPGAFVTEAQAAAGALRRYRMLVVPAATLVHDRTLRAITHFIQAHGRVVVIGKYSLHRSEYNLPLPGDEIRAILSKSIVVDPSLPDSGLRRVIVAQADSVAPVDVDVVDAGTGQPLDSIEWRSVRVGRRYLVNLVNYGSPRSVSFRVHGRAIVCARELVRGGGCLPGPYLLRGLTPSLFEFPSQPRRPRHA